MEPGLTAPSDRQGELTQGPWARDTSPRSLTLPQADLEATIQLPSLRIGAHAGFNAHDAMVQIGDLSNGRFLEESQFLIE